MDQRFFFGTIYGVFNIRVMGLIHQPASRFTDYEAAPCRVTHCTLPQKHGGVVSPDTSMSNG